MAKKTKITPLGDRVLVKPVVEDIKTKSGLIIPETVGKEKPDQGKVVAVGEGRYGDDNELIPMKVKVGDVVLFSKYSPDEIKIDDEDYFILREENILAVIK